MDFFKDFSDLSNTPIYSKYNQSPNKNKLSSVSNKGAYDQIDLLSNFVDKQQSKKSKKNIQPYSSQNLPFNPMETFNQTTQKFYKQNTDIQINYNFNNLSKGGNKASKKSLLDDLMSQDNQSYKSGKTGRRNNQTSDNFNDIKISNQINNNQSFQPNTSNRSGMRPPLKKRNQSRDHSVYNDDKSQGKINQNFGLQDFDLPNATPKIFRNQTTQEHGLFIENQDKNKVKFENSNIKQKLIPKPLQIGQKQNPKIQVQQKIIQKIIHIKEDNKQLSQRYEQQLKLIKQSYERQINNLKNNYQKIIQDQQQNRKKIIASYQVNLQIDKKKWQKILQNQVQRVKQLYQWQNKKKTQSYQLEINKLKKLIQTITKSQQKEYGDKFNKNIQKQTQFTMNIKLKQFKKDKQRFQNQKNIFQLKKRQFQSQQMQFNLYQRKQQDKLNQQRKKLYQYETQLHKRQIQIKKQFLSQKQSLATQLINAQISLNQGRQNLKHQNQKLQLQKELFIQQKQQYQKINNNILLDLKQRKKNLEIQRQQLQNLQIQLYKKINTIQLMSVQKGLNQTRGNKSLNGTINRIIQRTQVNKSISNYEDHVKENFRNRINSQLNNKIQDTKNRYAHMQQQLRASSNRKESFTINKEKIHLDKYMEKLTKEKLKLHKY